MNIYLIFNTTIKNFKFEFKYLLMHLDHKYFNVENIMNNKLP